MTTTTTSFCVDVLSAPPPTVNNLDPEERSRLLRSTRKLGAVLGATPIVVEAARHEGRVYHSRSSSSSSIASSEPDYVMVKSTSRSSPYQLQSLPPLRKDTPTPRPSFENTPASKKRKGASSALPPIALVFDTPGSQARSGSANPTGRSQPQFLRVRAVPEGSVDRQRIKTFSNHGRVSTKPLSPISSVFNMDPASPPSPTMPTPPHMLNEREKRRKLAKLSRTLGENIPPELVFHDAPRRSLSISHTRVDSLAAFQRPAKYAPMGAPPLAVAETPIPAPPRASTSSEHSTKSTKRMHHPRSLTLGSSSAIAAATAALTRGASLDAAPVVPKREKEKKELAFNATTVQPIAAATETLQVPTEFGRRKEREWSGEWNLKDMDDVAKRLRGLKGR